MSSFENGIRAAHLSLLLPRMQHSSQTGRRTATECGILRSILAVRESETRDEGDSDEDKYLEDEEK